MGGEPLCLENLSIVWDVIFQVKKELPDTKIYIWTGYTFEELQQMSKSSNVLRHILKNINVLIDGPYVEKQRDITLPMRGSHNQRIIYLDKN